MQNNVHRCDLRDFLADLLHFMEEQIKQALSNPADQSAAIDAATGTIPLMRDRLRTDDAESKVLWTQFLFIFENRIEDPYWKQWWQKFANLAPDEFAGEAKKLIGDPNSGDEGLIGCAQEACSRGRGSY